jgi:N6-adenosine-specific RNA methylase IME4
VILSGGDGWRFGDVEPGRAGVILADPPWPWKAYSTKGLGKSPERHYPTMSIEEICAIPVAQLAAPDCALFIWTTWPILLRKDAPVHRVLAAWGFRPSGLAWEWIKYNSKTKKYSFGGGYGTRKNLEPCILARRGSPKCLSRSERDFMYAPRREHSRKPDEQYDRIHRMYGAVPKVELFGRVQWPGWIALGNQVNRFQAPANQNSEAA